MYVSGCMHNRHGFRNNLVIWAFSYNQFPSALQRLLRFVGQNLISFAFALVWLLLSNKGVITTVSGGVYKIS